jgi:hypothetical protein
MRIELNRLLPRISDDAMRQYIGIKIDQILPAFSNQVILNDMKVIILLHFRILVWIVNNHLKSEECDVKCALINDVTYVLHETPASKAPPSA